MAENLEVCLILALPLLIIGASVSIVYFAADGNFRMLIVTFLALGIFVILLIELVRRIGTIT